MKYHHPLKQILFQTQRYWDRDESRQAVRQAFAKALLCGTPALGAEVFASDNEEKIVGHTCKGSACSSCGYRATVQWQRERWAALPDVPYKGITFTMPDVLWPLFRDNPRLLNVLPALAASIMQVWASVRHGVRVAVIAIPHTFNGRLEFNSHVHTMVTAGGLQSSGRWVSSISYDRTWLLEQWRGGVIKLLRVALQVGKLKTEMCAVQVEELLAMQESRWWSIKIQNLGSKEHFLRYAGRYARRPPIAQRRITYIGDRCVRFCYQDKKLNRRVDVQCSPEEFIDLWAQHVPERYRHAVRSFGLLGPRAIGRTKAAIFLVLAQKQRPRPKRISWAVSMKRDFGRYPLIDSKGMPMKWVRRIQPNLSFHAPLTPV